MASLTPPLRRRWPGKSHRKTSFYSGRTSSVSRGVHMLALFHILCDSGMLIVWLLPGYARVVLAVASLYYMPLHPRTCSFLYSISCLLDALDGYLARLFHQSTTFGSVLDMVTDRCTTACLLVFLASAWPRYSIIFQGLISLDLASHYMHMYATLSMGGAEKSHKAVDSSRSWILHKYYTSRVCTCPLSPF